MVLPWVVPLHSLIGNKRDPEAEWNPHLLLAPCLPDLGPVLGEDWPRVVAQGEPGSASGSINKGSVPELLCPQGAGVGSGTRDTLLGGHRDALVRVATWIQAPRFSLMNDVDHQQFTLPLKGVFFSSSFIK